MRVNRIEINGKIKGNELDVLFFSDQHIGSKDCNLEKVKEYIDWVKKTPNVIVIMLGDTVNCGLRNSVGSGSYDDVINPDRQIELAIELLMPIKKKIYGVHNGNHANRIYNETTLNPEKTIAQALGVPYLGDACFHYLRFKNQTYVLHTTHGSTGATTVTGALQACVKCADSADADLFAYGHTHHLANISQVYHVLNKQNKIVEERKRHFVLTGGFLSYFGSYAEKRGYQPQRVGSLKATFRGDKHSIHVRN